MGFLNGTVIKEFVEDNVREHEGDLKQYFDCKPYGLLARIKAYRHSAAASLFVETAVIEGVSGSIARFSIPN